MMYIVDLKTQLLSLTRRYQFTVVLTLSIDLKNGEPGIIVQSVWRQKGAL